MLCFVLDMYLFGRVQGAIFVFVECLLCLQGGCWFEDKIWLVVGFLLF